jgi:1-acyl-sn-glycerol-3-phosphate acyltransferase
VARQLHIIPVDTGRNLMRALQLACAGLSLGRILVVFPEGERSLDGRLREFQKGTALLLRYSPVPVIPVALVGAHRVMPRGRRLPRAAQVTVVFGPPLDVRTLFTDDEERDVESINRELRRRIAALLREQGAEDSLDADAERSAAL